MVSRVRTASFWEEFLRHIVRRSAFFGKMQLPQSLQPRRFFDNVPNRWRSAFFRAVVHDRHPRRDSVDQSRTSALTPAVVGDDVDINLPQLVFRTHQLHLFVMRQVAQIQNPKLAERDYRPQRPKILRLASRLLLGILAGGRFFYTIGVDGM